MSYPAPEHSANTLKLVQFTAFMLFIFALGLFGKQLNPLLLYQREEILQGQFWRLLTGHIVHLGMIHTLMNIGALCMVIAIFKGIFKPKSWLLWGGSIALGISLLFLALDPLLDYYAGLSGVIHGLIVVACIKDLTKNRTMPRKQSVAVLLLISIKLCYEQSTLYRNDYLQQAMNSPVLVDAHLYGVLVGIFLISAIIARKKIQGTP